MMRTNGLGFLMAAALAMGIAGCDDGDGEDAGTDAGDGMDAGMFDPCPRDPMAVPAPEELMGACCYRNSNATQLEEPELRIAYLAIEAPEGSPLTTMTVRRLLNESLQEERFNWLFRITNSGGDGPVTITTGYGRRNAMGTYEFSQGMGSGDPDRWCPITLTGDIAGEEVNTTPMDGSITVPVFDETGMNLQIELALLNISVEGSTFTEDRSCIGAKSGQPFTYMPGATLNGFLDVTTARTQTLMVGTVNTSVCAAVAGSLTDPMYCDQPQAMWAVQPDSVCEMGTCRTNTPGTTDVCDPASDCTAWAFSADFAAAGVDIVNDSCP